MSKPLLRVAVLASGRGTLLQFLIDARGRGELPIDIVLVAGDRPEANALRIAEAHGVVTLGLDPAGHADRASYDNALFAHVARAQPDLVVLAGFMRWLQPAVVAQWQGRMINIHPSLLPRHPGLNTHQRVLDAGDKEHGASVHYVTAELDGGPVIAQTRIGIQAGDDANILAQRLLPQEHRLLASCIRLIAAGRVTCDANQVQFNGAALTQPLQDADLPYA